MTTIYSIIESFGRQFWVEPNKFQDFYNFKITKSSKNITKSNPRSFRTEHSHKPEKAEVILFDRVMFFLSDTSLDYCFLHNFHHQRSFEGHKALLSETLGHFGS